MEAPYNWLYSFFIVLALGLWLISILGFIDAGEVDADMDGDADAEANTSVFGNFASFIGVGKIPLSIIITLILFSQGVLGIASNYLLFNVLALALVGVGLWISQIVLLGVTFLAATLGTAYALRPFHPLFRGSKADSANDLKGKVAKVTTSKVTPTFGQAIVKLSDGMAVEIPIRVVDENTLLSRGNKVLLIDYIQEKKIYIVEPFED